MAKKAQFLKEILMEAAALGGGGIAGNYAISFGKPLLQGMLPPETVEKAAPVIPIALGVLLTKMGGKSKKGGNFMKDAGKGMIAVGIANAAQSMGIGNATVINGPAMLPSGNYMLTEYPSPQVINGYKQNDLPDAISLGM